MKKVFKRALLLLACLVLLLIASSCGTSVKPSLTEPAETTSSEVPASSPEKESTERHTEEASSSKEAESESISSVPEDQAPYYEGLYDLQMKKVSLDVGDNPSEVYTFEDHFSNVSYLGAQNDSLYFLASKEDPETHFSQVLLLSVTRDPQGGSVKTLKDLGLFYDCQILKMVDDRIYLSLLPLDYSEVVPKGGAFVSIGTDGSIEILKPYDFQYSALFYEAGNSILFTHLPDIDEDAQILEIYNTKTRSWETPVQRKLSHDPQNKENCIGEWIYWASGMNEAGFYYATVTLASENPGESPAPPREASIWWHDRKSLKDSLVTTFERELTVTGDAHSLFAVSNENGSKKIAGFSVKDAVLAETEAPVSSSLFNAFTIFYELSEGKYVLQTPFLGGALDSSSSFRYPLIMDLKKGETVYYQLSLQGWDIQARFVSNETPEEILCLMTECLSAEQKTSGVKPTVKAAVYPIP